MGEKIMTSMPRSSSSRTCPFSSEALISSSEMATGFLTGRPICEIWRARKTRRPAGTVV